MGATKRYMEEQERLYDFDTKELVCSHHIKEDYIKKFILTNGKKGKCDYCECNRKVIELSEVLKLIVVGIDYYYEDPNESRYINHDAEYGLDGNIMPFNEMFYDLELEIDDSELYDDIIKYLGNETLYCLKDEYTSESEYYHETWNNFKSIVKNKARYVFHFKNQFSGFNTGNPLDVLDKVQHSILHFNLFREIKATEKLFRCRQHKNKNEIEITGINIASNPTENCKKNNRMSPAGISMFYCSPIKDVCVNEVVNFVSKDEPYYTTAYFTTKKDLNLVDLTKLPDYPSAFDTKNNWQIQTIHFLKDFIKDISKPIDDNIAIIDYVPTQIVTEYIRFNPKLKIDGLIYPSSKDSEKENYVLFMDHEESIKNLNFFPKSIQINKI